MTHVRSQIRQRFKDILEAGLPPEDYVVFASRTFARNTTPSAVVDIRFLNVNIEHQTMSDDRMHTASLYIRVQRTADDDQLDDLLDNDDVVITSIVENAGNWRDLLIEDPELVQVNYATNAETGQPLGAIILRYDVEYRVDKKDHETAKG